MNSAVERAVNCIWARYSDSLSLADLAQSALLSRFHFARIFKGQTAWHLGSSWPRSGFTRPSACW